MAMLQQFGILFSLGSLGIVLFVITSAPAVVKHLATLPAAQVAGLPPLWVLLLVQGLQSAVLLAIAIVIGIFCTRPVNLHSRLIDYWVFHQSQSVPFVSELKWSLGVGLLTTLVIWAVDYLLNPLLPEALQLVKQSPPSSLNSLAAVFYGGITEELLLRWGVMSLFVWLGWKLLRQGVTLPSQGIYQGAIVLAALVFGLLHLPMTATLAPLTPWVICRALVLNGIAGIAFGWLFWQYSLEAAMIAHASFHVLGFLLNSGLVHKVT